MRIILYKSCLVVFCIFIAIGQSYAGTIRVIVTDASNQALNDVIVYLKPNSEMSFNEMVPIEIEQRNREFNPFISVIPVGTSASFPNHDGIGHHVYSFSNAKTFELPLSEEALTDKIVFDAPGVVTIGCNIHDWMVGYIYVVETPYYAKTDISGKAIIEGISPGNYGLHIWHPGSKSNTDTVNPVSITEGELIQKDFMIDIRPNYFWKPDSPPANEEQEY